MKRRYRSIVGGSVAAIVLLVVASGASAAVIVRPDHVPTVVANAPVNVVASGFPTGKSVFVEQCDGVDPASAQWDVTQDCDNGASPPPVIADTHGNVTFPAGNPNRAFRPFQGESPQSLFNCIASGHTAPKNALKTYTNCRIRVSTNNTTATADQVFLSIVLSGASVPPPPAVTTTTAGTTVGTTGAPAHGSSTPTTVKRGSTPTTVRAETAGRKVSAAHGATPASSPSGQSGQASSKTVSVTAGNAHAKGGVGLFSLSNHGLVFGYVLVALGLLIVAGPALVSRRGRRMRRPYVDYATKESG